MLRGEAFGTCRWDIYVSPVKIFLRQQHTRVRLSEYRLPNVDERTDGSMILNAVVES